MDDQLLLRWEYELGADLFTFIAGLEPNARPSEMPDAARPSFEWLEANVGPLRLVDPRLPVALVRLRPHDDLPAAWWLRDLSGGSVPSVAEVEPLDTQVMTIARDVFPILLSPPDLVLSSGYFRATPAMDAAMSMRQTAGSHPLARQANDALAALPLADEALVVVSALTIAHMSEPLSIDMLLAAAARRLVHSPLRTAEAFIAHAQGCLNELRLARAGDPSDVPCLVGLATLPLREGTRLELPQGVLRAAYQQERDYAPFSIEAEAVLETSTQAITVRKGANTGDHQAAGHRRIAETFREVLLAQALACEPPGGEPAPSVAWVTELTTGNGSGAYRPLRPDRPGGRSRPVEEVELGALTSWARLVADADLSHVGIGIDRLFRALWEIEWEGSLIDAVVVWENLCGTRGETVFRVTAALAVLCEDDPSKRQKMLKDLSSTYNARSRLVHGDQPDAAIAEHRDRAVRVAVLALRRLICDRRDLLKLAKSSQRADRLLLGID